VLIAAAVLVVAIFAFKFFRTRALA